MWKCLQCGEMIESTFDACWNCGARADGTIDAEFKAVPNDPAVPDPGTSATANGADERGVYIRIGWMGMAAQLIAILAAAPLAGFLATFLLLVEIVAMMGGLGGMGLRISDFVDLRNYLPSAKAMLYSAPFVYFPAYVLCRRLQGGELSRIAFMLTGGVASLAPILLLSLNDNARLDRAWDRFTRYGFSDLFEFDTLMSLAAFAPASVILSLTYWWTARIFGEIAPRR